MSGVFGCSFIALQRDGQDGNQQYDGQRQQENPETHPELVSEPFEPAVYDVPGCRGRDQETDQDDADHAFVEHGQYCGDGSAEYFADGDLAAAVLGFEKHQSEHSDQRDQDRQQAEQDQLTREVRLFLVLVALFPSSA